MDETNNDNHQIDEKSEVAEAQIEPTVEELAKAKRDKQRQKKDKPQVSAINLDGAPAEESSDSVELEFETLSEIKADENA